MDAYHVSVLLNESIEGLAIREGGVYVDVTFGGGGHSRKILEHLVGGRLIAFDRDPDAEINKPEDSRFSLVRKDFKFIEEVLQKEGQVDGILADLGVSSHQFDRPERGFSFRFDGPLDMRMDPDLGKSAADILNEWEEGDLARMWRRYGEVQNAAKVARVVVGRRAAEYISRTAQFEELIHDCIPPKRRSKYLAQLYQALRIVVNGEMESLEALLVASLKVLKPGGRLVVISYHSLEDRMVKRFMRSGNLQDKIVKDFYGRSLVPWKLITRRAIQPSEEEIGQNPRARSARLRIAERVEL